MRFADPLAFLLLVVVAADALARRRSTSWVALSELPVDDGPPAAGRARWAWAPAALRTLALALAVVALARPRLEGEVRTTTVHGRNVMLALDISSSMKARDLGPGAGSRLDAAKRVLSAFVSHRPDDFLGLVVFAGRAFTQAPLTSDGPVVLDLLRRADMGLLPDGTAIGTALAMAEVHLEHLPRGSGVIVLLTDGGNNAGAPDPMTAAAIARALGIRVYAIGVSATRAGSGPPLDSMGRPATMTDEAASSLTTVQEVLLRRIATTSGGRYYRAGDDAALRVVMADIDRLERTDVTIREVLSYRELFWIPLALALAALVLAWSLRATVLRGLP
jgi:Ca-activated chloride channel homolog